MVARWCVFVPRKSRLGGKQAQTEVQTRSCRSNCAFTKTGSMSAGFSTAISTPSKPHALNFRNSRVLRLVNGEAKRNVFRPIFMLLSGVVGGESRQSAVFLRAQIHPIRASFGKSKLSAGSSADSARGGRTICQKTATEAKNILEIFRPTARIDTRQSSGVRVPA